VVFMYYGVTVHIQYTILVYIGTFVCGFLSFGYELQACVMLAFGR
jgi:hypothetical protein